MAVLQKYVDERIAVLNCSVRLLGTAFMEGSQPFMQGHSRNSDIPLCVRWDLRYQSYRSSIKDRVCHAISTLMGLIGTL